MDVFPGVKWNDVATAAVACMSPPAAWWTFWPGFREQVRDRARRRLERLRDLRNQLTAMGQWASTSYDARSHDPQWYNASFGVLGVPREELENFNAIVLVEDHPGATMDALVELEKAVRRFQELLAGVYAYRATAGDLGSRWERAVADSLNLGRALTEAELASVGGLRPSDAIWLGELYRRNKELHVRGIGGEADGALHARWHAAVAMADHDRGVLQSAKLSRWRWAGHAAAVLFAVMGLVFLADFWVSAGARAVRGELLPLAGVQQSAAQNRAMEEVGRDSSGQGADSCGCFARPVQGGQQPAGAVAK